MPVLPAPGTTSGTTKTTAGKAATLTGAAIAADALRYVGQGYVYGGAASRPGDWDCSSFVSYVLGRDLKLGLPGGKWGAAGFPPNAHGPVVLSYASWSATSLVGTPQAGDLCIWSGAGPNGHIGIATSPTSMVSALDPSQGTRQTPILGTGPAGAPLTFRRVSGIAAGAAAVTSPAGPGGGGIAGAIARFLAGVGAIPVRLAVAALVAVASPFIVVGALIVLGTAGGLIVAWLLRRMVAG